MTSEVYRQYPRQQPKRYDATVFAPAAQPFLIGPKWPTTTAHQRSDEGSYPALPRPFGSPFATAQAFVPPAARLQLTPATPAVVEIPLIEIAATFAVAGAAYLIPGKWPLAGAAFIRDSARAVQPLAQSPALLDDTVVIVGPDPTQPLAVFVRAPPAPVMVDPPKPAVFAPAPPVAIMSPAPVLRTAATAPERIVVLTQAQFAPFAVAASLVPPSVVARVAGAGDRLVILLEPMVAPFVTPPDPPYSVGPAWPMGATLLRQPAPLRIPQPWLGPLVQAPVAYAPPQLSPVMVPRSEWGVRAQLSSPSSAQFQPPLATVPPSVVIVAPREVPRSISWTLQPGLVQFTLAASPLPAAVLGTGPRGEDSRALLGRAAVAPFLYIAVAPPIPGPLPQRAAYQQWRRPDEYRLSPIPLRAALFVAAAVTLATVRTVKRRLKAVVQIADRVTEVRAARRDSEVKPD